MTRLNYGDDAEYDAFIESRIDPEWTGRETDPSGWMADREQARWERDRGSADMLAVVFCAVAFLLVELSFAHARFAVAALAVIGLWVTVAVPVAVVIGRGMGGRR
jgi:hypothetical protein